MSIYMCGDSLTDLTRILNLAFFDLGGILQKTKKVIQIVASPKAIMPTTHVYNVSLCTPIKCLSICIHPNALPASVEFSPIIE